jgi:hypothetical protein
MPSLFFPADRGSFFFCALQPGPGVTPSVSLCPKMGEPGVGPRRRGIGAAAIFSGLKVPLRSVGPISASREFCQRARNERKYVVGATVSMRSCRGSGESGANGAKNDLVLSQYAIELVRCAEEGICLSQMYFRVLANRRRRA